MYDKKINKIENISNNSLFNVAVFFTRPVVDVHSYEKIVSIIVDKAFNWDLFLGICFKQKVAGLVFSKIKEFGLEDKVPYRIYNILQYFYLGNFMRNEVVFSWIDKIVQLFNDSNIDVRPLKGSILIPECYKNKGVRVMNDIDFFINKADIKKIAEVMGKLDFFQGEYSRNKKKIIPLDKNTKMLWKLKMYNLPPFKRMVDSPYIEVVNVDFAYGLSFFQSNDISSEILRKSEEISGFKTLDKVDFFIHLCCHLYKEASNEAWIELGQDINLIKFCDVFICYDTFIKGFEEDVVNRSVELGIEVAMYFSLLSTAEIYSDERLYEFSCKFTVIDTDLVEFIYKQGDEKIGKRNLTVIEKIVTL